ncbi:MAG: hypothetical protein AAGB22_06840, partial [Bacteroidota bacterium]
DSIDLTFIRRDSNIRIQEPLDQYLCGDTVLFRGSNSGCQAAITWSAATFPAGSPPTVLSPNTQNTYIIFTASGWYSIVYDLAPNGPCAGGSDTVEFYICITNAPPRISEINTVCDSFPDTICLNTPAFPGANYGPWTYVAVGAGPFPNPLPTIIPDAMDPTKAIAIIHDQSVDRYDFNRQYTSDTCERVIDTTIVDGGQVITDTTIICIGNHDVIWQKANLEIVADTVDLLCGGDPFFRVSENVTITSDAGFSSRMNIIGAPNPCPNCNFTVGGTSVPTNQTLNLTDCGIYQFEVIASTGPCRDTAILTVRVGDLPMPNAGVTADFCVNDTVELVGSSPGVSCVNIDPLWTQLSGPAPLVFLEPETLTNPDIQATATGSYTLMYSFSTENECILTDTLSFDVIDCDTIMDTCSIDPDISVALVSCAANATGDLVYDFDIRIWDPNGDGLNAILTSANGTVSNVAFTPDYPIPGVLQVTGTYTPVNPSQQICLDLAFPASSAFCDDQICMPVPDCDCAISNTSADYPDCISESFCFDYEFDYYGPTNATLTFFVDLANSTPGFTLTSPTGGITPVIGHNVVSLCFSFSGECSEDVHLFYDGVLLGLESCKIWEMITLPCCPCDEPPCGSACTIDPDISIDQVRCGANANGDVVYDFDIRIWDPNGDAMSAGLSSANGTVSNVVFTPDYPIPGVLQVTGTYTPTNPSQEICLDISFPDTSPFC